MPIFQKSARLAAYVFAAALATVASVMAASATDVERARNTKSCAGCDLSDANLSGLQAPHGDFTGANLRGTIFYGGDLSEADLTGAVLDGANLTAVNLAGAIGVAFIDTITDERTTCPNGQAGPCE